MSDYTISYEAIPDGADMDVIGGSISRFNEQQAGNDNFERLSFFVRAADKQIVGGIVGATYWEWFYIDVLWVSEELRGLGYGRKLLKLAEEEAARRGARHAYLDTFSFQAPGFYEKNGYTVFGELPDFPSGHSRYFLVKALALSVDE
jgi:ribosomal protein S18 acetylase RimI-like enzyme